MWAVRPRFWKPLIISLLILLLPASLLLMYYSRMESSEKIEEEATRVDADCKRIDFRLREIYKSVKRIERVASYTPKTVNGEPKCIILKSSHKKMCLFDLEIPAKEDRRLFGKPSKLSKTEQKNGVAIGGDAPPYSFFSEEGQ